MPVNAPVEAFIVPAVAGLLVHTPPDAVSLSVVVLPGHNVLLP